MTDTKRDFLYDFNRELRDIYSNNTSIVSVFENIDKGTLRLAPVDIPGSDFVNKVGKCIFMIKKIVADPYRSFKGSQEVVPVSQAQNVDPESVKLTLSDPSLWAISDGKRTPKKVYTLVNDYVFINYENAFICQFINLLIARLKKIKNKIINEVTDKSSSEFVDVCNDIDKYVHKLVRLSNEKVFVDNNRRVVDMANIFLTDILSSDNRYNYCYRFFCENFKSKNTKTSINRDFRVLYHNFALTQVLYGLYKAGYKVDKSNYYVSESGKVFINSLAFSGEKELNVLQSKNGIDITCEEKTIRVEFSKSLIVEPKDIGDDYNAKVQSFDSEKYSNIFVAYLSSAEQLVDGALSIGYKNVEEAISKLIKSI